MRTDELDYELDPRLIATRPVEPRDQARLLVVDRDSAALVRGVQVLFGGFCVCCCFNWFVC